MVENGGVVLVWGGGETIVRCVSCEFQRDDLILTTGVEERGEHQSGCILYLSLDINYLDIWKAFEY